MLRVTIPVHFTDDSDGLVRATDDWISSAARSGVTEQYEQDAPRSDPHGSVEAALKWLPCISTLPKASLRALGDDNGFSECSGARLADLDIPAGVV